jgi:hypothetical protein
MSLKKALGKVIKDKLDANHQDMDVGLPYDKYQQKAGANTVLTEIQTWLSEYAESDESSDGLGDLEK